MPKRAVAEALASAFQVTSGSGLPREKVELAFKLLEVSSRILRVLFVVDRVVYQSRDDTELNALKERVKTLSSEKTALEGKLKKLSQSKKG